MQLPCNFTSGGTKIDHCMAMDTEIELDSKNGIKNKESTIDTDILIFLINSMFWIAEQGFFFRVATRLKHSSSYQG